MEKKSEKIKKELISSRLDGHKISVTLLDGKPDAVAFFDIDRTLAHLDAIHAPAMKAFGKEIQINENDLLDIDQVYFAGFKLGTSYREFDRLWHIYFGNKPQWKDPRLYISERLEKAQNLIDNPHTLDHKRAAEMMNRYFSFISHFMKNQNQSLFEKAKIKPLYRLMNIYKRRGIPMFGMTANGRTFVNELVKVLHLNEYFVDVGTDEDMAAGGLYDDDTKDIPGGKEAIIPSCLRILKSMGIENPKTIICIGDSFHGDIGSAYRVQQKYPVLAKEYKGIFIIENSEEFESLKLDMTEGDLLYEILRNVSVETFELKKAIKYKSAS